MTVDLGRTIYISDAQSRIQEFEQFLRDGGRKPSTVDNYRAAVRVSLKEIKETFGNIPLASFDARVRHVIEERHSGPSAATRQRIQMLGVFIRWCTGTCLPEFLETESTAQVRTESALVRIRYGAEIAHLTEALEAEGRSRTTINNIINDAGICLTALNGESGAKPLSEIGIQDMIWLEMNLDRDRPMRRHRCMTCLGRLVSSACGHDPYREFKSGDSLASYEARLRGTPFCDEILAMIQWMADHNYRPDTIRSRVNSLTSFLPRVIGILGEFRLEDVTMDTFYLLRSRVDGLSERTLSTYMQAFEALIEFTTGRRVYNGHRMLWNKSQTKRTFITQEEWKTILASASKTERIAIMLASLLGLRCMEIVDLRLEDMTETQVTIHGKGHGTEGKVAVKDIPQMLKKEIADYMEYRRMLISRYGDASEGHFIINDRQNICGPMTRDCLKSKFTALSAKTGIHFSAHTFRRFYACTLSSAGVAPDVIMRMMRHESIDTTLRCYLRADPGPMKAAEDALERQLSG